MKRRICGILVVTQLSWLIAARAGTNIDATRPYCAVETETSSMAIAHAGCISTNPVIAVYPRSLDFTSVAVGRTRNLTFTVQNVGAGRLTGAAEVSAPFRIVGGSPYALQTSQTQVITVQYMPRARGMNMAVVRLTAGGGRAASITVAGSAVPTPAGAPRPPQDLRLLAGR